MDEPVRTVRKVSRVINNTFVAIQGRRYILYDMGGRILHKGACTEEDTPRKVYERHYPPPEKDGKLVCDVTLFYGDLASQYGVMRHVRSAVLQPCCFSDLDEQREDIPGYREDREGYRLHYQPVFDPRPQVWTTRPRIIAARGQVYEIPHHVLFTTTDPRSGQKPGARLYYLYQQEQDAIVRYLDDAGIAWCEL